MLVLIVCISSAFATQCVNNIKTPIHQEILNNYKHDMKALFKAWHFVFGKEYDYNTVQGINRFKTFKQNVKMIWAHNESNSSYKKAINHLADMTNEEIKEYYHLKPMSVKTMRRSLRQLNKFNLDDYNEDEEDVIPERQVGKLKTTDFREHMTAVRNQKNCGSCWAFTTQSVLEGQYAMHTKKKLPDHFSTQQSVDCDTGNGGCNGGWYNNAFDYFTKNSIMWEKAYPYKAARGTCAYNGKDKKKSSGAQITGYNEYDKDWNKRSKFEEIVNSGPTAVAVDANNEWYYYSGGVFTGKCSEWVNHAVTLVGWQPAGKCDPAHWIIRNSWGSKWGEEGYMRLADEDKNHMSCNVEKYAYNAAGWK